MPVSPAERNTQIIVRSYLWLRISIGFVALMLPLLVIAVFTFSNHALLPSISDSYHHPVTNSIFIGSMVAFATFLWAYQVPRENILANIGAVFATLIAVAPNLPQPRAGVAQVHVVCAGISLKGSNCWQAIGNVVHFASAAAFFFTLGLLCVWKWATDSQDDAHRAYRVAGIGIWIALLAAAVTSPWGWNGFFILCEIVMVELFGLAWLIRGGVHVGRGMCALASAAVPTLALWAGFVVGVLPGPAAAVTAVVAVVVGGGALYMSLRDQTPPTVVDEVPATGNRFADWTGGTKGLGIGFPAPAEVGSP
ncbi:hypothetical protein [Actinomycetospora sp.]|uniref:hypothetical protein n=1 Tax=Actinomycetospora sp. TaxID=1872135 RepID=UPI002F3ED538